MDCPFNRLADVFLAELAELHSHEEQRRLTTKVLRSMFEAGKLAITSTFEREREEVLREATRH